MSMFKKPIDDARFDAAAAKVMRQCLRHYEDAPIAIKDILENIAIEQEHSTAPEERDTARLDWLQGQLRYGWGDGFAMHPLDGGALYPRPWRKANEALPGMEPDMQRGTYLWQKDIRTAIDEAMRRQPLPQN